MRAQRIAIYGKGGIGKSTVATSLSVLFAMAGDKVLHVGCDPKRDSSLRLIDGAPRPSVLEALEACGDQISPDQIVSVGRHGVELVEAGGPEPGVGCAGRGVSLMLERLDQLGLVEQRAYDRVVYDVLGDVVCGGFAAPLRRGIGQRVYIVTSEEPMSLYAANNIAKAVVKASRNGVSLGGLIVNLREQGDFRAPLEAFASSLGTRIIGTIQRDPLVRKAEYRFETVVEYAPKAPSSVELRRLADAIRNTPPHATFPLPTPLDQDAFVRFVRAHLGDRDAAEPLAGENAGER